MKRLKRLAILPVAALLFCAVVRTAAQVSKASTSAGGYKERLAQIRNDFAAERERLGIDQKTLKQKYPTPEITLLPFRRVVPGSSVDVVAQGKFAEGTKFVLKNDNLEVLKEVATGSEYRATVRVPPDCPPSLVDLEAIGVSGASATAVALYIGGKYQWDLRAKNGWSIKLEMTDEGFNRGVQQEFEKRSGGSWITGGYRASFYRGGETKPFEVRHASLKIGRDEYQGNISEGGGEGGDVQAEFANLAQKMSAMGSLPEVEQEKLMARLEALTKKMEQQVAAQPSIEELQKKQQEFGCGHFTFSLKGKTAAGNMSCGAKVGTIGFTGASKFLGP